jgi:XFP N-terminal domain
VRRGASEHGHRSERQSEAQSAIPRRRGARVPGEQGRDRGEERGEIDDELAKRCEDSWRSHQVPMSGMDRPEHIAVLERWLRSYRPEQLFDATGRLTPERAELAPGGRGG